MPLRDWYAMETPSTARFSGSRRSSGNEDIPSSERPLQPKKNREREGIDTTPSTRYIEVKRCEIKVKTQEPTDIPEIRRDNVQGFRATDVVLALDLVDLIIAIRDGKVFIVFVFLDFLHVEVKAGRSHVLVQQGHVLTNDALIVFALIVRVQDMPYNGNVQSLQWVSITGQITTGIAFNGLLDLKLPRFVFLRGDAVVCTALKPSTLSHDGGTSE